MQGLWGGKINNATSRMALYFPAELLVARAGIEPPAQGCSILVVASERPGRAGLTPPRYTQVFSVPISCSVRIASAAT